MKYMEEDIQNYSPTVMFRGTPCIKDTVAISLHRCSLDINFTFKL